MTRDGLMTVGNTLIEACFAWPCHSRGVEIGVSSILDHVGYGNSVNIVYRPRSSFANALLDYH